MISFCLCIYFGLTANQTTHSVKSLTLFYGYVRHSRRISSLYPTCQYTISLIGAGVMYETEYYMLNIFGAPLPLPIRIFSTGPFHYFGSLYIYCLKCLYFGSPPTVEDDFILAYLVQMAHELKAVIGYLTQIPNQPIVFAVCINIDFTIKQTHYVEHINI